MEAVDLARWQFAITTVYHFFFVPLTIGLSALVAVMQTVWVRTGAERWLRLTRFFGKLFLINFILGVVTGLVQEFQFGMNWSEYSRFVGDIFGAPLALEGLLAFFLESTFLGLWVFGWDRLPQRLHLMCIWLASTGTVFSAYFILAANSFMQNPVGFTVDAERGRAELTDFGAVLMNPVAVVTFPHQVFACFMVAGAFVAAVAAWHLLRSAARPAGQPEDGDPEQQPEQAEERARTWRAALRLGAVTLLVAGVGVVLTGDLQGKVMYDVQPMKMAAAEAAWETEQPASFSVLTIGTLDGEHELFSIKIPYVLSFLATGSFTGEVVGIDELQAAYEATWGPGSYTPNIPLAYWSFRLMMGLGMASLAAGALLLWVTRGRRIPRGRWTPLLVALPLLPLLANSFGWIFTETGRQPWLVFGLLPTAAGVSPSTSVAEVVVSLLAFTGVYTALAVVEVRLMLTWIRKGLDEAPPPRVLAEDEPLTFAY
ncbi:cytochrome ubiquinol oxidase subunit I [Auraticoccus sp. F435]|uniref:Cytochrome ubiquinol oxidase subunit I n=1 Tax=Auraticoccus cholistanensis TaxID=2656650 RepID=A0A6A9USB5_9ACTN|nr:cytochrome ubiquinol oxidase subunit I [Auraticoccus cholistanensis]MVA74582.1 cytochrome ubiquinol oxidase subunit I [Auraticoccus cholistanensis]